MFAFNPPAVLHRTDAPVVSSASDLRRYERSPPPIQPTLSITVRTSTNGEPFSHDVTLTLRQQPKEALVTAEGKEKARKPVDPPPIIQLTVKPQADPAQHFLQSPYLFMCASLYKETAEEAWDGSANQSLAGSLVSSLHRLKDVDNKDGGFFVFGDISVKVQGIFRLHFSLFDLRKGSREVQYLGAITSEPFKVLLPKDFKGMDESTYLSRAFSDQGVRLRLRKEPRAMIRSNKRPYPYGVDTTVSSSQMRSTMAEYSYDDSSPQKRFRTETEYSYDDPSPQKRFRTETEYSHDDSSPQKRFRTPYPYHSGSPYPANLSVASYPNFTGGLTTGTTLGMPAMPAGHHGYANLQNLSYNFGYNPNAGSST